MSVKRSNPIKSISQPKRTAIISSLLAVLMMLVSFIAISTALTPKRYELELGDKAPETIYATKNVENSIATAALKEQARNNAQIIYKIDTDTTKTLLEHAQKYFDTLESVRQAANGKLATVSDGAMTSAQWIEALSDETFSQLGAMTDPVLDKSCVAAILGASKTELRLYIDMLSTKLTTALSSGLATENVDSVKSAYIRELNASTVLSAAMKKAAVPPLDAFMQPTLIIDERATETARAEAEKAVDNIMLKKGEIIVEKDSPVTLSQLNILKEIELVRDKSSDTNLHFGIAMFTLSIYAVFIAYLVLIRTTVFMNTRKMAVLTSAVCLTMLLMLIGSTLENRIVTILVAVMLTAILVDTDTAHCVNLLFAFSMGVIYGGRDTLIIDVMSVPACVACAVSGAVAIFALRKAASRGSMIGAGMIGAAAGTFALSAFDVMAGEAFGSIMIDSVWYIGSCLVSILLVVGSLPVWENLFDIATPARLSELTNVNHPLLKQLMSETPGTYQHSIMVAALAEGAAQKIGADALLARVAGTFHDVGKLRRPLYFMENQKGGKNIHDTLPPAESAGIIIAHQKDGAMILSRYKLPADVITIASEHHGNSLMAYFYHKALTQAGPENAATVNIKNFRYSGNRPSSKESAIVMLADSCEAAVRSLGDTDQEKVEAMITKVFASKMSENDNMLSNAPLTLSELTEIQKSFIKTFTGIMHDRIEYPNMEEKK